MARKNPWCLILGHKWKRQQRREADRRFILLTCRRCGHVDTVEHDLGAGTGRLEGGLF